MNFKLQLLLILNFSLLFFSCQSQNQKADKKELTEETKISNDTIQQLGNNIMVIYQDSKNNYWFGSWETGLYKYDGKKISHFTTENGLPHNRVEEIKEDKNGNLFFNTSGGLCKYNGINFMPIIPKVSFVWKLEPEDLWFKSLAYGGDVLRYDGEELYQLQLPSTSIGEKWAAENPGASQLNAVYSIYKDSKGNIWFGTLAFGACRYNGISFDWISEEDVHELHNGPANGVRSIIEDKDGYFWFNSAYRYKVYDDQHPLTNPFYKREKSIGNLDGKENSDFWEYLSITKDNNNELWIATYANGVWNYNGKKIKYYPVKKDGEEINIFCIYKDNQGQLWLGTHKNGAYKFNGKTFENFKIE